MLGAFTVVLISRAWNRESLAEIRMRRDFICSRCWGMAQTALQDFVASREVQTAKFRIGSKPSEFVVRKGIRPCLRYLGMARQARLLSSAIRLGVVLSRTFGFAALAGFAGIAASQLYLHLPQEVDDKMMAGGIMALALCFVITILTESSAGVLSVLESWIRSREPEEQE